MMHSLKSQLIISLTTYPARISTVNQTIDTLLNQTVQADKVILWLAPEQFPNKEADLPKQLLEQTKCGLTIDWYPDIRSYKKLIPTLQKYPDAIIVTADDDVLYKPTWLALLVDSYKKHPCDIQCHRATKFVRTARGFATISGGADYYKDASFLNKPTGVGGILYPPRCFYKDITDIEKIKKLAPTNDDQWFWLMAALNNVKIRVVPSPQYELNYIPGTQETALCKINDAGAKLFWRDFRAILTYYPELKNTLLADWNANKCDTSTVQEPYRNELIRWYENHTKQTLFLDCPRTFNEKIQWLKLYDSTPIKTRLADKFLVRDWIKEKIGEEYLIPLIGVYDSFEEIDFDALPDKFVIKCNHASGWNIVVKDKSKLNLAEVKQKLDKWLSTNFAFFYGFELHYRDIPPKITIEKYVENDGGKLYDYKFWCFNGQVKYMQFRDDYSRDLKMVFFDTEWEKQPFYYDHPLYDKELEKPDNYDEMIHIAQKLCQGFAFVCVDLYRLNDGTILFGEMTFTRSSGTGKWCNKKYNLMMGNLITLPQKAYNIDTGEYYNFKFKSRYAIHLIKLKNFMRHLISINSMPNKLTINLFGIRVWKTKYCNKCVKYYLFGVQIWQKKK